MPDTVAKDPPTQRVDLPTVISVTIIVYFLCCFLHEAVGHGGVATLLNVQVTRITNAYCSQRNATEMQGRIIASGGILLNALVGFLAIYSRRRFGPERGVLHYFIWLFAHMNLLSASGYMASFAFLPVGDLHAVVRGLPYEFAFRITIFVVGILLIIWTFRHAALTLRDFAGPGTDRASRARLLTFVPYFVGGLVNVAVSLLGVGSLPLGMVLMSSIGASFGGNFPLLWVAKAMPPDERPNERRPDEDRPTQLLTPVRSIPWIGAGVLALGLYVLLGHGIDL